MRIFKSEMREMKEDGKDTDKKADPESDEK
jgi:hypothetical protein